MGCLLRVKRTGWMTKCKELHSVAQFPSGKALPEGSELGPILFNILLNNSEIECTLSKFANDTKLSGASDKPDG